VVALAVPNSEAAPKLESSVSSFGTTPAGDDVTLYTLTNSNKMKIGLIDYGATLVSIVVPDKDGKLDDVLLGFDNLEGYLNRNFGSVTGRFANRIGGAKFKIDNVEYKVTQNAGKNHIHGGRKAFNKVMWKGEKIAVRTPNVMAVRFTYLSKDGEEGFPGNLNVTVTYYLTDTELIIRYKAETDKPTVINLTNHAYFNLAGAGNGDVRNHVVKILADKYTVADDALIPTGEIRSVKGTPLDFTEEKTIGSRIDALAKTRGYDHNYVLERTSRGLMPFATIYDPSSGRAMDVLTTEPGMQFYTANHLRDTKGRDGKIYNRHYGFCCETQHYPDSPNKPNFPTTILRPGEAFHSSTVFRFSVR
jgi:aldose 1-epimerase